MNLTSRNYAYFGATPFSPSANGPWLISGGVLYSNDATSIMSIALGDEYESYSELRSIMVGVTAGDIDAGDTRFDVTVKATRLAGETSDEFRLGVYWYDDAGMRIGTVQSEAVGTSSGLLTDTPIDFTRSFDIPPLARQFRVRIIAIKRNGVDLHARLKFENIRTNAITIGTVPFADTHVDIVNAILRGYCNYGDAQINMPSMDFLRRNNSGKAQYHSSSGTESRLTAITALLKDLLAGWTFNSQDEFSVGQLRTAPAVFDVLEREIVSIESVMGPAPVKELTLFYDKNYTLQNADVLAGGVAAEDPAFLDYAALAYRSPDPAIAPGMEESLGAVVSESNTFFTEEADAILEQNRQLALLSQNLRLWQIVFTGHQLQARIFDTIRIHYSRWRFTSPRSGILLSTTERSGATKTTEVLWLG